MFVLSFKIIAEQLKCSILESVSIKKITPERIMHEGKPCCEFSEDYKFDSRNRFNDQINCPVWLRKSHREKFIFYNLCIEINQKNLKLMKN